MSSWTTTVPNSVRNSAPVGQTSRQAACVQCLQTSEDMSQRMSPRSSASSRRAAWLTSESSIPSSTPTGLRCSTNATWRQVSAPSPRELSIDQPVCTSPSSGTWFHSLQATSHALHPMQTLVSVKKPIRGGASSYPASGAGSSGPYRLLGPTIVRSFPRFGSRAGASAIVGDIRQQRRPGRPPARPDVTRADLALLDEHVRVELDGEQVVGRVALDERLVRPAPVVGQPDLVDSAPLDAQRP